MKVFGLLALLLVSSVASATQYGSSNNRKEYDCKAYTSNTVNSSGYSTDNPQQTATTRIVATPSGYSIRPGVLYNHVVNLKNDGLLALGNFAGDKGHLIAAKENAAGLPYFVIWEFDESMVEEVNGVATPKKGALRKIITLGQCAGL